MSVLDDFRSAEQRVVQRLKELEPAVAEYRELEAVANRLGITVPTGSPVQALPTKTKVARARRKASARRAANAPVTKATSRPRRGVAPGQRRQQVLELVRARPGITVTEAGAALGVDPTGLYRVVHRLEQSGDLRKNGRALEPVSDK